MRLPKTAALHTKYVDHEVFAFVAANNSTGSVTALVEATRGDLPTVKVYITGVAAQAGAGDITGGRLYLAVYNSLLDGGSGGLVLK